VASASANGTTRRRMQNRPSSVADEHSTPHRSRRREHPKTLRRPASSKKGDVQQIRPMGLQPAWLRVTWIGVGVIVVVLAVHGATGVGGEGVHDFLENWLSDLAVWVTALVCVAGAIRAQRSRAAWLLIGAGLIAWAIGDTIWSLRGDTTQIATVSDVFWLAWYPLLFAALVLLVRDRVPAFELHRWIDGVVVMLLVATPWVALFLQPAAQSSHASTLGDVVDFAYPLGDAIIVGATLGVMALMGWRPGRMWMLLGLGFAALGVADAIYSVNALGHSYSGETTFDALWLAGMALIAYAAWLPHPGQLEPVTVTGWRAIALPVAAQCLALSLQVYALFYDVPRSERIFTIVVLIIATVQIIVTRPRPPALLAGRGQPPTP
jgi:hypothetical protein